MDNINVCSNLHVTSLVLSGFVEVSGPSGKEYLFIIDVTWSDNRSLSVKRTYKDFMNFRQKLVSAAKRGNCDVKIPILQGTLTLSVYILHLCTFPLNVKIDLEVVVCIAHI